MLAYYKDETDNLLYNLLDSHDTERFLYLCHENKKLLKLAAAFQMLFPGSPAIYYGDEVGMTGDNDPDCRRCMEWGDNADQDMRNWYRKLIQLRKDNSCIKSGSFRSIIADEMSDTYGLSERMPWAAAMWYCMSEQICRKYRVRYWKKVSLQTCFREKYWSRKMQEI